MRTLSVLTVGVSLVFGLQASEWTSRQEAGQAAMQQHDYSGAAGIFGDAVPLAATAGERRMALASCGIALGRADRNAEARTVLEQALAADSSLDNERAIILAALASVNRSLGDYRSAEKILRAAIAEESPEVNARATLMVNLADMLREEARNEEASQILGEASKLPGLPRAQAISILVERAELSREMRLWDASIEDWDKVAEIATRDHSVQLEEVYTGGLGETWLSAGNLARAEPLVRRSLELLRNDPAASSSQIATALAMMANVYMAENKLALAAGYLDEAISRDEASLGTAHPQVGILLELRASILSRRGEPQPARDDLERARDIMAAHFGSESTAIAGVDAALGDVEQRANRPAVAATQYSAAMKLLRAAGAEGARYGAALVARYAAALKADHRGEEATAFIRSNAVLR